MCASLEAARKTDSALSAAVGRPLPMFEKVFMAKHGGGDGPTIAASAANNGKTTAALAKRAGADGQRQTMLGGGASTPDTKRGKTLLGQ